MDSEIQEKFHGVEMKQKDLEHRTDGLERLLEQQAQAFDDFKKMLNDWAKKFAIIIIVSVILGLEGSNGSTLISLVSKVVGL